MSEKQPIKVTNLNSILPVSNSENPKPLKKRLLSQDDLSVLTHREFMEKLDKARKNEQQGTEEISKESSGQIKP